MPYLFEQFSSYLPERKQIFIMFLVMIFLLFMSIDGVAMKFPE